MRQSLNFYLDNFSDAALSNGSTIGTIIFDYYERSLFWWKKKWGNKLPTIRVFLQHRTF